jgi:hypothetical protein
MEQACVRPPLRESRAVSGPPRGPCKLQTADWPWWTTPKKNEEKYQLTYIPIKIQKLNPSHRFIQHNFGSWFSPLPNIVFQEAKKSKVERSSIEWFLRKRTMVPNVE